MRKFDEKIGKFFKFSYYSSLKIKDFFGIVNVGKIIFQVKVKPRTASERRPTETPSALANN